MARASIERPFTLMPGEDPDGTVATARHWLAVYDQLLLFIDRALTEPGSDAAVRAALLRRRVEFRRRLVFWEAELRRARAAGQRLA